MEREVQSRVSSSCFLEKDLQFCAVRGEAACHLPESRTRLRRGAFLRGSRWALSSRWPKVEVRLRQEARVYCSQTHLCPPSQVTTRGCCLCWVGRETLFLAWASTTHVSDVVGTRGGPEQGRGGGPRTPSPRSPLQADPARLPVRGV